jgi:hypothetical protein
MKKIYRVTPSDTFKSTHVVEFEEADIPRDMMSWTIESPAENRFA